VLPPPPALVPVPLDQGVRGDAGGGQRAVIVRDDGLRRVVKPGARGPAACAWCDRHALPCLPAWAVDVVAFLAAERGRGLSVTTVELRRAAIRYLHFICGCAVPTAEAQVAETMAGMHRTAAETGRLPARKRAATAEILRQILEPIDPDLAGLRDRALLLLGLVEHLAPCDRGLRLTLPHTKGERTGRGVSVAIPYGTTELCPIRALRSWEDAAGITEGQCSGGSGPRRAAATAAISPAPRRRHGDRRRHRGPDHPDPRRPRRLRPALLDGHSLKRGALSTGMARGVHPTRLKQLGRHKSYALLDVYLELGDPRLGPTPERSSERSVRPRSAQTGCQWRLLPKEFPSYIR
jgi:hypothetical protein